MRTSRISKDAARLFDHASGSISPPRRTTRSSLARFSYATPSTTTASTTKDGSQTPDIEDVIPSPARKRRKVSASPTKAVKAELLEEEDVDILAKVPSAKRARKPARTVTDPNTGEIVVEPPSNWEEMYEVVRAMRRPGGVAYPAVVDTMGCERLADENASPRDQRFHTLIALMLSSQTKDTVNAVVMKKLQTELPAYKEGEPKGLNLENILAVDPDLLNQMIWAVGFHNNKTKFIKKAAEILRDTWKGDIPDTIEGLTSLPGVGPKMAHLCMSVAWGRTEGIGVDVHVHRITNLWGWNKTKTPEETRLSLQSWLPQERWHEINTLLVGLGQAICLPRGSHCGKCDLGLSGLCKAADRKKVIEGRKLKEEKVEELDDGTVVKTEKVKREVKIKEELMDGDE